MAIEHFNVKKIIVNLTIPKTKILMTSLVATILITGIIFMSSHEVFAHKMITELDFEMDTMIPVPEGTDVLMTGTVTTLDTPEGMNSNAHPFHPAENPVIGGTGKIQQGFFEGSPVSVCEGPIDDWVDLENTTLVSEVPFGIFTNLFETDGLAGQTLVFRAHYSGGGGQHGTSTVPFSECLELEIVEEGDQFDGFKTWTHTDYNWDPVCDDLNDSTTNVDPTTGDCLVGYRDRNIYFNGENEDPDDDVLADSLDITVADDDTSDVLVKIKGNGEIANMIPGAIYALTTVYILADIDMLQVDENYADCTDDIPKNMLELLNQNNLSRNVKVAIADSDGYVTEVTDKLYDESDSDVEFLVPVTNDLASVKINDGDLLTPGSTVFVLVKFDDKLEGQNPNILPQICMNTEDVTSTINPDDIFEDTFEAYLRMTEAQ